MLARMDFLCRHDLRADCRRVRWHKRNGVAHDNRYTYANRVPCAIHRPHRVGPGGTSNLCAYC